MGGLIKLSRGIDAVNQWIGRKVSWLILVAVLVSTVNASVRKALDVSSNAWLELQWVLFSAVFLLAASWTLLSNEHIRIDIVNSYFPKRVRDAIDVVGHALFLLPLTVIMLITSLPFFLASVRIDEQSANAGGLPQWPAKSLIFIGFAFLFAQGVSELIKRIAIMRGLLAETGSAAAHQAAAMLEAERIIAAVQKTEPH